MTAHRIPSEDNFPALADTVNEMMVRVGLPMRAIVTGRSVWVNGDVEISAERRYMQDGYVWVCKRNGRSHLSSVWALDRVSDLVCELLGWYLRPIIAHSHQHHLALAQNATRLPTEEER